MFLKEQCTSVRDGETKKAILTNKLQLKATQNLRHKQKITNIFSKHATQSKILKSTCDSSHKALRSKRRLMPKIDFI